MIGEVVLVILVAVVAGGAGLWLGMVVLEPRLRRRLGEDDEAGESPEDAGREPHGRAD